MNPNRVSAQYKDKSRYPSNVFKRPFMVKPALQWGHYQDVFHKIDTRDKVLALNMSTARNPRQSGNRLPQKPPTRDNRRAYY